MYNGSAILPIHKYFVSNLASKIVECMLNYYVYIVNKINGQILHNLVHYFMHIYLESP